MQLKLLKLPQFSLFPLRVLIVALVQALVDLVQTLDALVRVHVDLV